jgi:hypothetical protein
VSRSTTVAWKFIFVLSVCCLVLVSDHQVIFASMVY